MKRRPTVELKAIIEREPVFASPPPAPAGTSLREWFAGLAIGNAELMRDIDPSARVQEALRVADELLTALATARVPSQESMAAPTEEEMQRWDEAVAEDKETKERQSRATMPELRAKKLSRTKTLMGVAVPTNPPSGYVPLGSPNTIRVGSIPPPAPVPGGRAPDAGRYMVMLPKDAVTKVPPSKTRP